MYLCHHQLLFKELLFKENELQVIKATIATNEQMVVPKAKQQAVLSEELGKYRQVLEKRLSERKRYLRLFAPGLQ